MNKKYYLSVKFCAIIALAIVLSACGNENKSAESTAASEQAITENAPEAKLNINTASDEAFRTIPGVGDKMVHEFNEYQPYVSIREFRKEIGKYVDEAQVAEYEKYIYVPIGYNTSDVETLAQIPGLESGEAESLAAKRPYESKQAFIKALSSSINEQQMEVAKSYLKDE